MKTFAITHSGVYMDGISIVTAKNKKQAIKLLELLIKEKIKNIKNNVKYYDVIEIDIKSPNAQILFNGGLYNEL